MDAKNKKLLFGIGTVIVLVALLSYFGVITLPSFAILSSSYNVEVDNGKVYHIVQLTANQPNGGTYLLDPKDVTLPNGSVVKSNEQVTFSATPKLQRCEYLLTPVSQPIVFGYSFNLWKEYTLKNAEFFAPVTVSTDNGQAPIILEAGKPGNRGTITDSDGKGIAEVETVGGFSVNSYCPPSTGAVMVVDASGNPKVMDSGLYQTRKQAIVSDAALACGAQCLIDKGGLMCQNCIKAKFNDIKYGTGVQKLASFHSSPIMTTEALPYGTTTSKTGLRLILNSGELYANPVLLVSADQEFVDSFIYNAPIVGEPKINSFSSSDVSEASSGKRAVVFGNTGDTATFTYTASAKRGTISPQSGSVEIEENGEAQRIFDYTAPTVTADAEEEILVKLCAGNQFGGKCTEKTFFFGIKNDEGVLPPAEVCGNGKCLAGETQANCPIDCGYAVTCEYTPNSHKVGTECVCNDGFETKFDVDTGIKLCEEPSQIPDWAFYAVGAVAIGMVAYAVLGGKKGGRRK